MLRWRKIILGLTAAILLALASLPWWLGFALRPILRTQLVSFESYERLGYGSFKLHHVRYARAGLVITAAEVQSDTPLLWLALRLRGLDPLVTVDHWLLRHTPNPSASDGNESVAGMADLQLLLIGLVPILDRWVPRAELTAGELRGFTPELTVAHAVWQNSALSADGLGIVGRTLAVTITATPDNAFNVTAHTSDRDAHLTLRWSATDIQGRGAWWDQPVELAASFGKQGWLPAQASAVAEQWNLAAARLKLGAPYERVRGSARAVWRDDAFELSLDAKAEPEANTKAPAFEAHATAHGKIDEITLTSLLVNAPFATAKLSAPVTFTVAHPPPSEAAELSVKVDLAKLPWIEARGTAEGSVKVAPGDAGARQDFQLDFTNVAVFGRTLEKARVRGVLAWPRLTLETLEAQLDQTSSITARGAIDWQTREWQGASLQAKVGPGWFARWLPEGAGWDTAEISATAQGPLDAPRHEGTVKLSRAILKPLHPLGVEASWEGTGAMADIRTARVTAGDSTLELAGSVDAKRLQLTKLTFSPDGQLAWRLAAPTRLTWSPVWQVDQLRLAGENSAVAFNGKGGAGGFAELTLTTFDSDWLRDWVALAGPHWLVHSLHANGRDANGLLAFDADLAGRIAMQPRPADFRLKARGDAGGIDLQELTVVESKRELTRATGQLPLTWQLRPASKLSVDETAPLELNATTDPDSPLWSALSAYTGLNLTRPEAKIALQGTVRSPEGAVRLQVAQLGFTKGKFKVELPEFDDLALALQLERQRVTLSNLKTKVDGQELKASGRIPMDDAQWKSLWDDPAGFDWKAATALLEIPDADLAALSPHFPNLIAPKGRLRARVALAAGGKFSGELHLIDATARPLPPFSTLQEINADLSLSGRTLTVEKLTAKLGGEPVVVDGSVTLAPDGSPRLALGLKGKNLPLIRNTGLLIRNDLDLRADTNDNGVTRISGTVTLHDSLVLANLGALLPTGQRGVTRQPPYFSVEAEPFRAWPLAVEVRGEQAIRIRTTVFSGTASAHFQLGGTLGEPRAVGELTVDQGQVLFPFATFTVQTGTVRLREADPFRAVVNLNALSHRRGYQLRLEATGELPSPNVVLSSTPALEAEQVLLMVMTGQPPDNTGANASSAGQRLALLGAYLGRGIFQDLGFGGEDRLEISTGEQVSDQGRETYDFEYKLGRRWSLTGEYDRFDDYNAGLKYRVYTKESEPIEKK